MNIAKHFLRKSKLKNANYNNEGSTISPFVRRNLISRASGDSY